MIAQETDGILSWANVPWKDDVGSLLSNVKKITELVKNPHYPSLAARANYIQKLVNFSRIIQNQVVGVSFDETLISKALDVIKYARDTVVVTNVCFKLASTLYKLKKEEDQKALVIQLEDLLNQGVQTIEGLIVKLQSIHQFREKEEKRKSGKIKEHALIPSCV